MPIGKHVDLCETHLALSVKNRDGSRTVAAIRDESRTVAAVRVKHI